jgi:predicted XRE-type DNA-binding protein
LAETPVFSGFFFIAYYINISIITVCRFCKEAHMKKIRAKKYDNVWDALADTPAQAANLRVRAELMRQIAALVKKNKWTQVKAASQCGVSQPRINDLLRGRVSHFSLDALVNIATALDRCVHVGLKAA